MKKYKPNLEAFNNRPDLIFVIDRFNYVEYILNEIIINYIDPAESREDFVRTILLNTAIVSFGSKLKLFFHLNAIEEWTKLEPHSFHRLAQIRNQFAHSGKQVININLDTKTGNSDSEFYLMLESVTGNGKLVKIDSKEALEEFTQLFAVIKENLNNVPHKLKMANKMEQGASE